MFATACDLEESGGDQLYAHFPENHRFQIPDECHWADVRKKTTNVGQALQRAVREIEKANPDTLYAIFGDAQWTNEDRLSDTLLRDLIEHFSKLTLGNKAARADLLGQSYEYAGRVVETLYSNDRGGVGLPHHQG